jgi:hypothetical protein
LAFSYWFDKPWFHNWGKTCYCAHHTFLLGFPTGCYLQAINYLQGENLRSLVGRRRRLCTLPFLKASILESLEFKCCLGGGCISAARVEIP